MHSHGYSVEMYKHMLYMIVYVYTVGVYMYILYQL